MIQQPYLILNCYIFYLWNKVCVCILQNSPTMQTSLGKKSTIPPFTHTDHEPFSNLKLTKFNVFDVAFNNTGNRLYVVGTDLEGAVGSLFIWNMWKFPLVKESSPIMDDDVALVDPLFDSTIIKARSLSIDDPIIFIGSSGCQLRGKYGNIIHTVAVDPLNEFVVIAGEFNRGEINDDWKPPHSKLFIWNTSMMDLNQKIVYEKSVITSLKFHPTHGEICAGCDQDCTVILWKPTRNSNNTAEWPILHQVKLSDSVARSMIWFPAHDGKTEYDSLMCISQNYSKIIDVKLGTVRMTLTKQGDNNYSSMAYSPTYHCLYAGGWGKIDVLDVNTCTVQNHIDITDNKQLVHSINVHEHILATGGAKDTIRLWLLPSMTLLKTLRYNCGDNMYGEKPDMFIDLLRFHPSGNFLIASGLYCVEDADPAYYFSTMAMWEATDSQASRQPFEKGICAIVQLVHPELEPSLAALTLINKICIDFEIRLVKEAFRLKTQSAAGLTCEHIEQSIVQMLSEGLSKHAVLQSRKAVQKIKEKRNPKYYTEDDDIARVGGLLLCASTDIRQRICEICSDAQLLVSDDVAVFLIAAEEYLVAEIVELSGNLCRPWADNLQSASICHFHVNAAISDDEELVKIVAL
jgi:WD40 repeat protein